MQLRIQPRQKRRSAGSKRHPGRLFFGYFLLRKNAPAFSAFTTSMWLGEAKESISPAGARTGIKIIVALATQQLIPIRKKLGDA
jgi:hypothetical protein